MIGPRILVVEDEPLVAMLLEDMLLELGYAVVRPASTLQEGLALAQREAIDAAILDVNLNGVRSFPIAEILQARSVPYFFATGYGSSEDVVRRGVEIVKKPFRDDVVQVALDRLLANPSRDPA